MVMIWVFSDEPIMLPALLSDRLPLNVRFWLMLALPITVNVFDIVRP